MEHVVGPGGTLGGIEWGIATDGTRIYTPIGNNAHQSYATGNILWQVADPVEAIDPGSVSVANGVVYAGSYSGTMYAFDAQTGHTLWTFTSGGSLLAGPAIVDGTLFWGSGHHRIPPGTTNNQLYAFSLP